MSVATAGTPCGASKCNIFLFVPRPSTVEERPGEAGGGWRKGWKGRGGGKSVALRCATIVAMRELCRGVGEGGKGCSNSGEGWEWVVLCVAWKHAFCYCLEYPAFRREAEVLILCRLPFFDGLQLFVDPLLVLLLRYFASEKLHTPSLQFGLLGRLLVAILRLQTLLVVLRLLVPRRQLRLLLRLQPLDLLDHLVALRRLVVLQRSLSVARVHNLLAAPLVRVAQQLVAALLLALPACLLLVPLAVRLHEPQPVQLRLRPGGGHHLLLHVPHVRHRRLARLPLRRPLRVLVLAHLRQQLPEELLVRLQLALPLRLLDLLQLHVVHLVLPPQRVLLLPPPPLRRRVLSGTLLQLRPERLALQALLALRAAALRRRLLRAEVALQRLLDLLLPPAVRLVARLLLEALLLPDGVVVRVLLLLRRLALVVPRQLPLAVGDDAQQRRLRRRLQHLRALGAEGALLLRLRELAADRLTLCAQREGEVRDAVAALVLRLAHVLELLLVALVLLCEDRRQALPPALDGLVAACLHAVDAGHEVAVLDLRLRAHLPVRVLPQHVVLRSHHLRCGQADLLLAPRLDVAVGSGVLRPGTRGFVQEHRRGGGAAAGRREKKRSQVGVRVTNGKCSVRVQGKDTSTVPRLLPTRNEAKRASDGFNEVQIL
eukprot:Rhum_TRINITY_DN16681_c0_g1::Rhum_TRINITY_DN16681_c0_g1_i1::g.164019::m.164019